MANNSSHTAQYDDVDDAYGEASLRAYHEGLNWHEHGVNEIDAFFPEPRNSPPTIVVPSADFNVPDSVSQDVPASTKRPSPSPYVNNSIAVLHGTHGNSGEVPSGVRPEQTAPSSAHQKGNVADPLVQTSQSSLLFLTSDENHLLPPPLSGTSELRSFLSTSPEHEEIYSGPVPDPGNEDSYIRAPPLDNDMTGALNSASPDPADARDETGLPSHGSKREGSASPSSDEQPAQKKVKLSAGFSEDRSDDGASDTDSFAEEHSEGKDSEGEEPGEEGSAEGSAGEPGSDEEAPGEGSDEEMLDEEDSDEYFDSSGSTPPTIAATTAVAPPVTPATLALFNNNALPPKYPFDQPPVSSATLISNWPRYGFVSLAAAKTWTSSR